jgi:hypothetical protein
MTSQEWRRDPTAVASANSALNSDTMSTMLTILDGEGPLRIVSAVGMSDSDKHMLLGREIGYREAIAKLFSLAILDQVPTRIEATYLPSTE